MTDGTRGRAMLRRLTGKAGTIVLTVLGLGTVVVAASRVWATGSVVDPLVGQGAVSASGGDLAQGVVALALVVGAAALAAATSGRVGRIIAVMASALALLGAAALTVRVLLDPGAALGPVAAAAVGRAGSLPVQASPTAWPWLALAGMLVAALGWVGMLRGVQRWSGLSGRYDAPDRGAGAAATPAAGSSATPRASASRSGMRAREAVVSDWDALSAGSDPMVDPDGRA